MNNEITDLNVEDLIFKNLPKNKEVILVAHGKVYQYGLNFYVNGIFKENIEKPIYHISLLPLKVLSAYPLGMIFKNQQIININTVSAIIDSTIKIEKLVYKTTTANRIPELAKLYEKIPEKIDKYSYQRTIAKNQKLIELKDHIGHTIIFPVYEILRWFYFRSSSMTRQVLACSLEGLYKEAKYTDDNKTKAELYLKYGSNNNDISEIFRFAVDEFAKINFENISFDLTSSIKNIESKNINTKDQVQRSMTLSASFPVYGEITFKLRGFAISKDKFFVYQILEENSSYPFEELIGYRELSSKKDIIIGKKRIPKKKPNDKNLSGEVIDERPSDENESVSINSNGILIENIRKDLENKNINIKLIEEDDDLAERRKDIEAIGTIKNLSLNNKDLYGKNDTAHADIKNVDDEDNQDKLDNLKRNSDKLELFKEMIAKCVLEDDSFSYTISNDLNVPSRPKNIRTRKQYKKSKLADGITYRKYVYVNVNYNGINYTIIEIEKDELLDKLSTLIIRNIDNIVISEGTIYSIVKAFIEDNGRWFLSYTNINIENKYLVHPDFNSQESITNWCNRLLNKLT